MLLGVGAKKKTYIDDVFSTYLYNGTGATQSINNGVNLAKGGMLWTKYRGQNWHHVLVDTERGSSNILKSNTNDAQSTNNTTSVTSFNNNGFSLGSDGPSWVNASGEELSSWSFRKAKGFFDVVTWTGNGANRTIAHSLGCIPGCIMIKCTSTTRNWQVYHRGSGNTHALKLNESDAKDSSTAYWNDSDHTSTHFSLGYAWDSNKNGETYVAYVFAGGESTAATAKCVEMDGSDYFDTSTSSDYTFGTGDFTVETWIRIDEDYAGNNNYPTVLDARTDGSYTNFWVVYVDPSARNIRFYNAGADRITSNVKIERGLWYHIAVVRNSAVTQFYVNGIPQGTYSDSTNYSNTSLRFGANAVNAGYHYDGAFSNLRVVKGTAVYTSAFKPPTAPLTNITNTKLLCFNDSSTTGTTVGTITATGDPTASTDSPFDDPDGFKFGENGDQNVIKCGTYLGNGLSDGPKVNLGWEPSFLLIKRANNTGNWRMFDRMRGLSGHGALDSFLQPHTNDSENSTLNCIDISPTDFEPKSSDTDWNGTGDTYVYIAIRRPDGYVGKPAEAGTDVFTMDVGNNSTPIPLFDSGFPVDFALARATASSNNWWVYARLIQKKYLEANTNISEGTSNGAMFDSNVGFYEGSGLDSGYQAWMWKRHAGFDVITYTGTSTAGHALPHSLGRTPEMIWVRPKSGANSHLQSWRVYHKGLDGGTNPSHKWLSISSSAAESDDTQFWNDTEPTSTHVTLGNSVEANNSTLQYIMMLFSSVDGISKVGYFTGSSSDVTITTGFQPRFVIIKSIGQAYPWMVLDSVRGWGSSDDGGDDPYLRLNLADAQVNFNNGYKTSTGFVVDAGSAFVNNGSGSSYIYYAHA